MSGPGTPLRSSLPSSSSLRAGNCTPCRYLPTWAGRRFSRNPRSFASSSSWLIGGVMVPRGAVPRLPLLRVPRSSHSPGPDGQGASGRGRRRLGVVLLPTYPGQQLSDRRRGGHVLGAQHLEKPRRFDPAAGVLGSECPIPVCMLVGGVHSLLTLPQG